MPLSQDGKLRRDQWVDGFKFPEQGFGSKV